MHSLHISNLIPTQTHRTTPANSLTLPNTRLYSLQQNPSPPMASMWLLLFPAAMRMDNCVVWPSTSFSTNLCLTDKLRYVLFSVDPPVHCCVSTPPPLVPLLTSARPTVRFRSDLSQPAVPHFLSIPIFQKLSPNSTTICTRNNTRFWLKATLLLGTP